MSDTKCQPQRYPVPKHEPTSVARFGSGLVCAGVHKLHIRNFKDVVAITVISPVSVQPHPPSCHNLAARQLHVLSASALKSYY